MLQDLGAVGEDVGGEDVEGRLLGEPQERRLQDLPPVAADDLAHRGAFDATLLDQPLEERRLQHAQPDVQADPDQDDAEVERYPPTPAGEAFLTGDVAHDEQRAVREEQTDRDTKLGPAGDQAAPAAVTPLHREQDRAAPFAADADPLGKAEDDQEDGAPNANRRVGRHEPDQEGRHPHQEERRDQGRLTSDPVAVVPEDGRPDRASNEPHRIDQEGLQGPDEWIRFGKEELGKKQAGCGGVQKEVVPLN